jgi:peptidoglycan/xylan/chitin deacetylase (PgdA/CDA1 family)
MKTSTIPLFLRIFCPSLLWSKPTGNQQIYLTFDDGPHPKITNEVLDLLDFYKAKATFFCVGENVERFPEIYANVGRKGHLTGNHSFNHLNGWNTPLASYYENVCKCRELVDSRWFRPPYGKITPAQIQSLKKEYNIVMWSVLSHDYDIEFSISDCIAKVEKQAGDGSIVIFHDSEKARERMLPTLEHTLKTFRNKGFRFSRLDE